MDKQPNTRQGGARNTILSLPIRSKDTSHPANDNGIGTVSTSELETSAVDAGQSPRVHRFIVDGIVFNSRNAANNYMNKGK